MYIKEIKNQVEEAMQDKQEFADLCFHLVPQLIEEIEKLQRENSTSRASERMSMDVNPYGY